MDTYEFMKALASGTGVWPANTRGGGGDSCPRLRFETLADPHMDILTSIIEAEEKRLMAEALGPSLR